VLYSQFEELSNSFIVSFNAFKESSEKMASIARKSVYETRTTPTFLENETKFSHAPLCVGQCCVSNVRR